MKKTLLRKTGLALASLAMIFGAVSCVKDGSDTCNNILRIVYDYNMDRVDKFHVQVNFLSIFVFDSQTGLFEEEIKLTGPFNKDFEMFVPQHLHGKSYDYMVWAGLNSDSYSFPATLTKGVSKLEDFQVQVKGYEEQLVAQDLEPLWHGLIRNVKFEINDEKTEVISLMKDTKTFRVVFSFTEGTEQESELVFPYDIEDLELSIYSADGWYDYTNTLLDPVNRDIRYATYLAQTDDNGGYIFELNTLRLMADRNATLVVRVKSEDTEVFRMPLNNYLNLLRLTEESWVSDFQEYLDREDNFRILIFINNNEVGENGWLSFKIMINDWTVREHNIGGNNP